VAENLKGLFFGFLRQKLFAIDFLSLKSNRCSYFFSKDTPKSRQLGTLILGSQNLKFWKNSLTENMFKFIVTNETLFFRLSKTSLLSNFFMLNLSSLKNIEKQSEFDEVIKGFRYGDVTGKETYVGRFVELDKDIINILENGMSVHDVGCSTGITSLEFFKLSAKHNLELKFTISDKFTSLFISKGLIKAIFDSNGVIKQIYFLNILLDQHLSPIFFLSKLLFKLLFQAKIKAISSKDTLKVSLLAPEVKKYEEAEKLSVIEYDIFKGNSEKYDFIRCMNVLNRSYFSNECIKSGLQTLLSSIKTDGYLLLGRTTDKRVNKATLYKKTDTSICCIKKYNGGCEIEDLLLRAFKEINL